MKLNIIRLFDDCDRVKRGWRRPLTSFGKFHLSDLRYYDRQRDGLQSVGAVFSNTSHVAIESGKRTDLSPPPILWHCGSVKEAVYAFLARRQSLGYRHRGSDFVLEADKRTITRRQPRYR